MRLKSFNLLKAASIRQRSLYRRLLKVNGSFRLQRFGNDRFGAALVQLLTQFAAVIGSVAEHALRWLHSSDQALCERAIVRLASSQ